MNSFLSTVARHALENNGSRIKDLHFIFPNRRAVQVFKSYLIKLADKPIWTPHMSSVDDWMVEISGIKEADKLSQLLLLYISIREKTGQSESLDNFVRWGEMLLRDYDEIDKYLVAPKTIFSSIKSIKDIETQFPSLSPDQMELMQKFWKGFHPSPSAYQKGWLSLWESLFDIYNDFHKRLKSNGLSTSGQIYRGSVERMRSNPERCLPLAKYMFIGFNALTAAEEEIFEICQKQSKAEFFWDMPSNLHGQYQESGRFIRANMKRFPSTSSFSKLVDQLPDRFSESFPPNFKAINIHACESASGQVGLLKQVLNEDKSGTSGEIAKYTKAVILADETLLEPVLSAISDPEVDINISMGYPVVRSLIVDFLTRFIDLNAQLNARKNENLFVPAKDLMQFINHPVLTQIMGREFSSSLSFVQDWPTGMLPLDLVLNKQKEFQTFLCYKDSTTLPEALISILTRFEKEGVSSTALESESFWKIREWLLNLRKELDNNGLHVSFDTLKSLFQNFVQKERLSFEGSLDADIQLTGILETRLMDYDELIILSCNEGVWPADASPPSLIPYSIRKAHILPTREFSDSFYGYYFYRLLQRARKVSLMYVSSPDPARMSQGDPSRFIQQLRYDSNQLCNEYFSVSSINPPSTGSRAIQKSGVILKALTRYLEPGERRMLSPSAINSYVDCPLRFALQYLLRIREGEDLVEAGEPRMFGLLMHKSLELFYRRFIKSDTSISPEYLKGLFKNKESIEGFIKEAFLTEYFKMNEIEEWPDLYGKDLLVYDVISKQLVSVLTYDSEYAPFKILGLEKRVEQSVDFSVNGEKKNLLLGGVIDRIDEKDGVIRILDYKSGSPAMRFKMVEDLFDSSKKKRPREILQASIYSIMVSKALDIDKAVKPVIYPTGKMRSKSFDPGIFYDGKVLEDIKEIEEEVVGGLRELLAELFDPDIEFCQTENEDNCEYCPFKDYCNR